MKIAYCIPSLWNSGGMERVLTVKANYLAERKGWDVTVITTGQHGREPYFALSPKVHCHDLDVNYDSLTGCSLLAKASGRRRLQKVHKARLTDFLVASKFDVVVSMFTHEVSFLHSITDGSRKVLELHFSKRFRALDARSNGASLPLRVVNAVLDRRDFSQVNHYDRFVVLTKEDMADWGVRPNILSIYNPVTLPPVSELPDYSARRVIAVGRLCAQKGFDLLLGMWAELPERLRSTWSLDIYGSGPDETALKRMAVKLGIDDCVTFHGAVADVREAYQSGSVFAFPSRYEGYALSLVEAGVSGLPAVAFRCPCGPAETIEDGITGYLVDAFDTASFVAQLEKLMTDGHIRAEFGSAAREHIQSTLSLDLIMEQWVALFNELR